MAAEVAAAGNGPPTTNSEPRREPRSSSPLLSAVWWFVLGGLGLIFPFYSLYLRENAGLSGTQVGAVMATLPLIGLIAQPFWGHLADRTGRRVTVLAALAFGTCLGYCGLAFANSFSSFIIGTALLALFSTPLLPGCVSLSLALLPEPTGAAFGRVRVMGTIGFGVSVGLFPVVLRAYQRFSPASGQPAAAAGEGEAGLRIMFFVAALLLLLATATTLRLPEGRVVSLRARRGEWRLLVRNGLFARVLIFTFLAYLFIQGPMVLFPILVRAQGGGLEAISRMWLIMLTLEIPLLFYFGVGLARMGPRGVIAIGITAAAVRWGVSGFVDDLRWVYLVQVLHGVTVWGVILGVPLYVDAIVPQRLRSTGQGLLAMIGVSLGSIISNVGAGWLTEVVGPKAPARVAGVAAGLLALALPLMLPATPQRHGDDEPAPRVRDSPKKEQ